LVGRASGKRYSLAGDLYPRATGEIRRRSDGAPQNLPKGHHQKPAHTYQLNTWVDGLQDPWSLAFLSETHAVVTEKRGRLYEIVDGKLGSEPITGLRNRHRNPSGTFRCRAHPDYAHNGWLYLAFSDLQKTPEGKRISLTRVIRGKLHNGRMD